MFMKLLQWFYDICIRMSEIGVQRIGKNGEKYADWEYPDARDKGKLTAPLRSINKGETHGTRTNGF